jgi:hypothetical protein
MSKSTPTAKSVSKQMDDHSIEFGEKYRDSHSGFEGVAIALYFFEHGCMRVNLRGMNGDGDIKEYAFDAPELERADTDEKVPAGARSGGPHDLAPPSRSL